MAFSEEHVVLLENDLFDKMRGAMLDPMSRWHNPHFAAAMGVVKTTPDEAGSAIIEAGPATKTTEDKPKRKSAASKKPKSKSKTKKRSSEEAGLDKEDEEDMDKDGPVWDPMADSEEEEGSDNE